MVHGGGGPRVHSDVLKPRDLDGQNYTRALTDIIHHY